MPGNLEKHRADLKSLAMLGEEMLIDLSLRGAKVSPEQEDVARRIAGSFERNYQRWYTEAAVVVEQLIQGRFAEFEQLYSGDPKRKTIDAATFTIQDWLTGRRPTPCADRNDTNPKRKRGQDRSPSLALRVGMNHIVSGRAEHNGNGDAEKPFDALTLVSLRLKVQLDILRSAEARFRSSLFDIRQLVRADLFDSELDACRELSSHGFLRAAGSIAGVLLEKHLRQTAENHAIVVQKSEPTIGDYNDQLKKAVVVDVPVWRHIQRLADIRNLSNHSKHREPHKKEIDELIDGVDRIVRTLF